MMYFYLYDTTARAEPRMLLECFTKYYEMINTSSGDQTFIHFSHTLGVVGWLKISLE